MSNFLDCLSEVRRELEKILCKKIIMENKSVEETEAEIIRKFNEMLEEIEGGSLMNEIKAERSKELTRHLEKSMLDPSNPRMPSMQ